MSSTWNWGRPQWCQYCRVPRLYPKQQRMPALACLWAVYCIHLTTRAKTFRILLNCNINATSGSTHHSLLLGKHMCYGFTPPAILWIKSYLSNRTNSVFFNGSLSNIIQVESGIPQGSCLGPLLFSIFTNDISKASVSMYADDSTLYTSAITATEITAKLNKELQLVTEWVARNKLVLNIYKTKSILFWTNHSLNPKPQWNIVTNNVEIEQVEVTKLLGVTRNCKLSWSKHIDTTVARLGRSLSIIKRCSTFLTTSYTCKTCEGYVCVFRGHTHKNCQGNGPSL